MKITTVGRTRFPYLSAAQQIFKKYRCGFTKRGLINRTAKLGDLEWTYFDWSNSFSEFPKLTAVLDFSLERVDLEKGNRFWVDVAVLPCDEGMFNEQMCRADAITF